MPFWPFRRERQNTPIFTTMTPAQALLMQAGEAFFAKRWQEAERLYLAILAGTDRDISQVARNMLGQVYERQKREHDAVALYEANLAEQCPYPFYVKRLAIIYHRLGHLDDEKRVLMAAKHILPPAKREWYAARLAKMK